MTAKIARQQKKLNATHQAKPTGGSSVAQGTRKQQLLMLVARPGGASIESLAETLGWQKHTVRAAVSGLRKCGHVVLASRSAITGETVYQLMNGTVEDAGVEPVVGARS